MNLDDTHEHLQSLIRKQANEVNWSDLETILEYSAQQIRSSSRQATVALLPALACVAVGGESEKALPIAAAWTCYRLAAHLLDDVIDADAAESAPWRQWGTERAMNVGIGLIALAQTCLSQMTASASTQSEIQRTVSQSFLFAARGQAEPSRASGLEDYFQYIFRKSSAAFAGYAWAGARLHTRNKRLTQAFFDFGLACGTFIQILDDLENFTVRGMSDLATGVYTLPIIFALQETQHPDYPQLIDLLAQRTWNNGQHEALLKILNEMDVPIKVAQMAQRYAGKARAALQNFPESQVVFLSGLLP
jgi:geranylgeranyl pyrophosphate synthase